MIISDKIIWIYENIFAIFISITNILRLTQFSYDSYYYYMNKAYSLRDKEITYDKFGDWNFI